MKKTFAFLMLTACMLSLVSCGKAHQHEFGAWTEVKAATCGETGLKERVCSCGEKETETIPQTYNHNYTSEVVREATAEEYGIVEYTCTVCGYKKRDTIDKIKTNWQLDYYVDDFGDKTKDAYVAGFFDGTFTASIARDANMVAIVYLTKLDPNTTCIRCLKYGNSRPNYDSKDKAVLKVKLDDGSTKSYDMTCYDGEFYCDDSRLVSDIFGNDEVSCVITVYEQYNFDDVDDTYKFKIDRIGLSELYEKTK